MSDERARLFVALDLPPTAREELVRWRAGAVGSVAGLRLTRPEHLHVTLCFLGWRVASDVESITAACERATMPCAPSLALGEAIWLSGRRPRVLAVSLADHEGATAQLQRVLSDALCAGGWYEPERRRYLPHVTVARVTHGARVKPSRLSPPAPVEFRGTQVTLYRSRLLHTGARYEALARFNIR